MLKYTNFGGHPPSPPGGYSEARFPPRTRWVIHHKFIIKYIKENRGYFGTRLRISFLGVFLCTYMSISFYNVISLQFLHVLKAFRAF